jgi:hypothetical protein
MQPTVDMDNQTRSEVVEQFRRLGRLFYPDEKLVIRVSLHYSGNLANGRVTGEYRIYQDCRNDLGDLGEPIGQGLIDTRGWAAIPYTPPHP